MRPAETAQSPTAVGRVCDPPRLEHAAREWQAGGLPHPKRAPVTAGKISAYNACFKITAIRS